MPPPSDIQATRGATPKEKKIASGTFVDQDPV
jgi:hypothetical protein